MDAQLFIENCTSCSSDYVFIGRRGWPNSGPQYYQLLVLFFLGNKTLDQCWGANSKNPFFAKFYSKFATFLRFFSFLAEKTLKMTITTNVCSALHPNTG